MVSVSVWYWWFVVMIVVVLSCLIVRVYVVRVVVLWYEVILCYVEHCSEVIFCALVAVKVRSVWWGVVRVVEMCCVVFWG